MAKRITSSTNHGWRNFLRREILRAYETDGEHNGDFNLIRLFTEAPDIFHVTREEEEKLQSVKHHLEGLSSQKEDTETIPEWAEQHLSKRGRRRLLNRIRQQRYRDNTSRIGQRFYIGKANKIALLRIIDKLGMAPDEFISLVVQNWEVIAERR